MSAVGYLFPMTVDEPTMQNTNNSASSKSHETHLPLDKMVAISQTIFSDAFS